MLRRCAEQCVSMSRREMRIVDFRAEGLHAAFAELLREQRCWADQRGNQDEGADEFHGQPPCRPRAERHEQAQARARRAVHHGLRSSTSSRYVARHARGHFSASGLCVADLAQRSTLLACSARTPWFSRRVDVTRARISRRFRRSGGQPAALLRPPAAISSAAVDAAANGALGSRNARGTRARASSLPSEKRPEAAPEAENRSRVGCGARTSRS